MRTGAHDYCASNISVTNAEKKKKKLYYMLHVQITYGRILVYIFSLISIGFSLSDDADKMKFLNIERA